MRPHPKASLVFLVVGVGFILAYFAVTPIWIRNYDSDGPLDWLAPVAYMALLCGIPAIVLGLISLGLGLHAARTHLWVLLWTIPLLCLVPWAFGGGLNLLLHELDEPESFSIGIAGLVAGSVGLAFLFIVLITTNRRSGHLPWQPLVATALMVAAGYFGVPAMGSRSWLYQGACVLILVIAIGISLAWIRCDERLNKVLSVFMGIPALCAVLYLLLANAQTQP
jgi:hypothetical protein